MKKIKQVDKRTKKKEFTGYKIAAITLYPNKK